MAVFDPNDENIPQKLWDHFESWATMVPTSRLQYLQYGLIDKYVDLKFLNVMVRPQGLMHQIKSDAEVEMGEDVGDVGDISINSTGALSYDYALASY